MDDFKIQFTTLHHINIQEEKIITKPINKKDAEDYICEMIENIMKNEDSRKFTTQSNTTEVISSLSEIACTLEKEDQINECSAADIVANRLLRIELKTNEDIKRLKREIKKGSLIQAYLKSDEDNAYLIAKIEHTSFIDENDLSKHIGLPYEKVVLKTCLIRFSDNLKNLDIRISDSNNTISKYWWQDFLELKEVNTDVYNTTQAFDSIDYCLSRNLKENYPYDYTTLRNSTIGYFRGHESFTFDELMENVFEHYEPENVKVDMKRIKEKVKKLPENKNFDRRFDIVQGNIKGRIRNMYKINDKIELNLLDHIENLHDIITAEKDDLSEQKYLRINVDNDYIYNTFHHN